MPHLSRKNLKKENAEVLAEKFSALLAESGPHRRHVFYELLTGTERLMLAKRLCIIFLISKKVPTHTISKMLAVSPSTVARFEAGIALNRYAQIQKWLETKKKGMTLLQLMWDLAIVPYEAHHKSLSRMMYERELREGRR